MGRTGQPKFPFLGVGHYGASEGQMTPRERNKRRNGCQIEKANSSYISIRSTTIPIPITSLQVTHAEKTGRRLWLTGLCARQIVLFPIWTLTGRFSAGHGSVEWGFCQNMHQCWLPTMQIISFCRMLLACIRAEGDYQCSGFCGSSCAAAGICHARPALYISTSEDQPGYQPTSRR